MDQLWRWPTIATVLFVSAVIVVVLVRRGRFKALLQHAAVLVPPPNSVVWEVRGSSFEPAEAANRPHGVAMITTAEFAPDVMESGTALADYLQARGILFSASSDSSFVAYQNADAGLSPKNRALDAVGLAGGGFIGMSLGHLLGRPLSNAAGRTAVTALLGIGGAFLGRLLSNRVKSKSFRATVEALEAERASALERIEHQRRIAQSAIQRFIEGRDRALRAAIIEERRKVLAAVRDARNSAATERHLASRAFLSHLEQVRQRIWDGLCDFRETHQSSIFTRWLYPSEGDVAVELAGRWARDASGRVEQLHTFLWTLLSSADENKRTEAARVISEFIRTIDCNADRYYLQIKVHADRVAALQQSIEEQPKIFDGRLKGLLAEAQRDVNAFIDATYVRLPD